LVIFSLHRLLKVPISKQGNNREQNKTARR